MRRVAPLGTAATIVSLPSPTECEWWGFGPAVFYQADVLAYFRGQEPPSKHLTRWYEIHGVDERPDGSPGFKHTEPLYWEWLKTLECPVYMQKVEPEIPNSVEFPKDKLVDVFGKRFGGSSNWVTAHAIYESVMGEKIDVIAPFGVDLVVDAEKRAKERELQLFLMGWAAGLGITIEAFDCLLSERMYGYEEDLEV